MQLSDSFWVGAVKTYQNIDWELLKTFRLSRTDPKTGRPYNQQDIARAIGKQQSYVSRLEKGDYRHPDSSVVEALASFFGLRPKDFVGYIQKRDNETNFIKDAKITYSSGPLPIPKYTQPYNARGMAYKDAILFDNADFVDRQPVLKNVEDAYAIVMPSHDMEPRYRQGDTLHVNPEISPERGDDVVIHLKFKNHTVCIIREVILMENASADEEFEVPSYGVLSLADKEKIVEAAYHWERHEDVEQIAKIREDGGTMFNYYGLMSSNADWFIEQNPEDENTLMKDEVTGLPLVNKDGSHVTSAYFNQLAEELGATIDGIAMAVHTIVGMQRHRLHSSRAEWRAANAVSAKPEFGEVKIVTESN